MKLIMYEPYISPGDKGKHMAKATPEPSWDNVSRRGQTRDRKGVKLRPLPQPHLRARTYAETYPIAQRATQLRSVLARVYSVSRQNLNTTTVP
jgi:hypothetical protein